MSSSPDASELLKLLLDESRLGILGLAARRPCTVEEMAGELVLKRAALAKQVAQLRRAGLLTVEQDSDAGERYGLAVAHIQRLKQELFARPEEPKPASTQEQVLASFVREGRLAQIPAQHRKRLIVLGWLAERFVPGRSYAEEEVNELLEGQGEDYASLRRYLVDYGFLTREGGYYGRAADPPSTLDAAA